MLTTQKQTAYITVRFMRGLLDQTVEGSGYCSPPQPCPCWMLDRHCDNPVVYIVVLSPCTC